MKYILMEPKRTFLSIMSDIQKSKEINLITINDKLNM